MLNAKLLLVVAACRKLGKKETSQFSALVDAIRAAWPTQAAVKGEEYAECSKAAQAAYIEAGGTAGGARYAWSVALSKCGLLPVTKDGKPMEKKGKTGAKTVKAASGKPVPPVVKSTISDAEAAQHFFGHSDKALIDALLFAGANEQAFLRWAAETAAKNVKPQVQVIKKDGTTQKVA